MLYSCCLVLHSCCVVLYSCCLVLCRVVTRVVFETRSSNMDLFFTEVDTVNSAKKELPSKTNKYLDLRIFTVADIVNRQGSVEKLDFLLRSPLNDQMIVVHCTTDYVDEYCYNLLYILLVAFLKSSEGWRLARMM